ncbi:fatty acid synthase-like [Amblyomma americanum]
MEAMDNEDIAITGLSARFPQADDLAEFKEKLYAGFDFITADEARWPRGYLGLPERLGTIRDLSLFDAHFFNVHPRQAHVMDPQMRLLLETSYEAMVDAGYDPWTLRGRKIGVFAGCAETDSDQAFCSDPDKIDGYSLLGSSGAMISNRLSYTFDFRGPSVTVDTACSSTITALNQAILALRCGQCEAAIVAGCMISLKPTTAVGFMKLGMLSPDGMCKAFDSRCNGFVRSETVGAFFIQRVSDARRIYAKVIHAKASADGNKIQGITYPSGKAQEELLREIYSEAKVDPLEVEYVEAHGTGTKAGDKEEMEAITNVFCQHERQGPLKIGAVKSNVGHNEVASGISSITKVILAMETGTIAANLHFEEPNPNIPSLHDGSVEIVAKPTSFNGGVVGLNSFGFGGSSAHVILESNPGPHVNSVPRGKPELPRLVLMSGRSEESLASKLERMEADGPYPDSAFALLNRIGQPSVKQFPYRGFAVVPVDNAGSEVVKVVEQAPLEKRPLWFVFTGMGCQWKAMARQMMQFDVFARSICKTQELLRQFGIDLIELVTKDNEASKSIAATLASITALQVALVDMLQAVGIQPDGMVGHSLGELGCAYADGCLTADQSVQCAYWRGRCVDVGNVAPGAMAAVGLTWEEAAHRCPDGVVPACHNSEESVTVSGPVQAVVELVEKLKAENVFARMVDSMNVAFHSKHVQGVAPAYREALEKVIPEPKQRSERWVSSSVPASRWNEPAAQLCSAEYHSNNLVSPVLFRDALQHVPKDAIVVEIAPHCLLLPILRRALGPDACCLGLMKRNADNPMFFLNSLGKLHTLGVQMDLSPLYPPVPFPVPRGTPSIGHLVSWDHSQRWTVAKYSDYAAFTQSAEDVVEVDLEANEGDAYLAGHQLDGRILFPATGYMMMAWKYLAKRSGKSVQEVPVIFDNVEFHRATILPKSGPVRFLVNVMRASGEFEICEAGMVAASGRIRVADEGEKILDKDPPGQPSETVIFELDSENFYKELRLRGYEYHGGFQAILKTDFQSSHGMVKWEDNWVTFIDNMLQFSILPGNSKRVFRLPVKIQSCRIDPRLHARIVQESADAGIPTVFDSCLNTCRAGGVAILGLKTSTAPRRTADQTPCLDEYKFVPYIDGESAQHERQARVQEYVDVCSKVTGRILVACGQSVTEVSELKNDKCKASEECLRRHLENPAKDHIILSVLRDIENILQSTNSDLPSVLQSALATRINELAKDLLNTVLFEEDPLRHLLDVAVENTSSKRFRVLELAAEGSDLLLAPWLSSLLPLSNPILKTEYTIAHPRPEILALEEAPGWARKVVWDPTCASETALPEADLIVVRNAPSERNHLEALAEKLSKLCTDHGFILFWHRTALTPAEIFLSTVGNVPVSHHARATVESVFGACGFCLVGRKCNNLSTLLLLRKANVAAILTNQDVVRVNNSRFDWVDTLKATILNCENKPVGKKAWLLADDSSVSGVVGLMNCLRVEKGVSHIRCLFDASQKPSSNPVDFMLEMPAFKKILERDLVMNIYRDGEWGSYRHLTTQSRGAPKTLTEYAFLNVKTRGDLSSLQWYESPLRYASPPSGIDGILCSVYYAPLNFRDVMLATGKLTPDALPGDMATFDCLLGLEFSGRDPQGRRVMGLLDASGMATVVMADADLLWEVPDAWSLEEASTVPVAYSTAYYALLVRGNMRPGESVLVHSGSGGVGQAAISVALSMGCTVFTTVGSKEKREFLKRRFPQLEDRNIANSRDLSFEEHVRRETKGRGVDLVLNSLSEEKLQASVRCLATHGRFLEIGKFDLVKDSPLGMSVFLKSAIFCGILLESLHGDGPFVADDKRRLRDLVQQGIASGAVRPLDITHFRRDQAEEAFRFMASGKHIGKVVLEVRPEESSLKTADASPFTVEAVARTYFYEHKCYVIIGGLGGFGLELADWMVGRGCRKLMLTSRSGVRTGYQKLHIRRWQQAGAVVLVSTLDASTGEGARQIIEEASAIGPVGAIFNLSLVLCDALLENQTAEAFEAVCRIKVDGTRHLDELSRKLCPELDHFVAFSSIASGHGNIGQTGYGYANSAMERICERRVADGLHGLAIQWGAIGDVGVWHRTKGDDAAADVYAPQRIGNCLSVLDRFLNQKQPVVSSFVKTERSSKTDEAKPTTRDIVETITHIFGVRNSASLDANMSLGDLGMDSLIGIEVQQTLERDYDVALSIKEIRKLTLSRLQQIGKGAGDKVCPVENADEKKPESDSAEASQVPRLQLMERLLPDRVLVDMNGLEGSTPLFVVHSIQGSISALLDLAAHLPVRAVGLQRTADIPVHSIEEMAATYLQKLMEVQPTGPYHLAGYSFGAAVAFEMALQMQVAGVSVASVTLLDGAPCYVAALYSEYECRFAGNKRDPEASLICAFLIQYTDIDVLTVRQELNQCPNWDAKKEAGAEILLKVIPEMKPRRQDVVTAVQAFYDLLVAGTKYRPRAKLHGDVVLVKASRPQEMARQLPPDYGLSEFVHGKVEVKVVDGSHETFLLGQGAKECAAIVSSHMSR